MSAKGIFGIREPPGQHFNILGAQQATLLKYSSKLIKRLRLGCSVRKKYRLETSSPFEHCPASIPDQISIVHMS